MENQSAIIYGPMDMRLVSQEVPDELSNNEVLLQMGSVGICGSDIKYWKLGKCGRFVMDSPMVVGHEGSGIVIKCGSEVKNLRKGDRVAIEPGVPCRTCRTCHSGRYNLCANMKFCATPPVDGNLCRYYKHPADFCFKLPENVSLDEGALIEPLSVAVYTCQRAGVTCGTNLLICGAGPVGLLCLMVAKASGADQIIMTDVSESRLELASKLGADHTVNVKQHPDKNLEQLADYIRSLCPVIDATLECSGVDTSVSLGIHTTTRGGRVILVGRGSMEPSIPLVKAATFEIDILGIFRYANCYEKAISLVASGKVNVKPLITHHFNMENTLAAFEKAADISSGAVKVLIHCNNAE